MFFVIIGRDRLKTVAIRARTRQRHMAHLDDGAASLRVLQSGPLLAEDGTICGSLIIGEADDIATVRRFADEDPYKAAGVFEALQVHAWEWRRGNNYLKGS